MAVVEYRDTPRQWYSVQLVSAPVPGGSGGGGEEASCLRFKVLVNPRRRGVSFTASIEGSVSQGEHPIGSLCIIFRGPCPCHKTRRGVIAVLFERFTAAPTKHYTPTWEHVAVTFNHHLDKPDEFHVIVFKASGRGCGVGGCGSERSVDGCRV